MKFSATALALAAFVGLPLALAAEITNADVSSALVIKDKYIVTYKKDCDPAKKKKHQEEVNKKAKKYNKQGVIYSIDLGNTGYVAEIDPRDIDTLTKSDLVDYIEKDTVAKHTSIIPAHDAGEFEAPALQKRAYTTQSQSTWGLGRISHRLQGFAEYYYDTTAGTGVRVYVLDTGIYTAHQEFGGRAVWGRNFIAGSPNTDQHGHGTHVAGTIAGTRYGVAKRATVVAVKILDKNGSGSMSGIVAGLNWVVADAKSRGIVRKTVVNLSVGGTYTASVNAAVLAATNAGVTVVVAAGNENDNAGNYSPSSASSAITVAAVEGSDYRAWFSNYGSVVDIFAPGVAVLSAGIKSTSAYRYLSGTSMG